MNLFEAYYTYATETVYVVYARSIERAAQLLELEVEDYHRFSIVEVEGKPKDPLGRTYPEGIISFKDLMFHVKQFRP